MNGGERYYKFNGDWGLQTASLNCRQGGWLSRPIRGRKLLSVRLIRQHLEYCKQSGHLDTRELSRNWKRFKEHQGA